MAEGARPGLQMRLKPDDGSGGTGSRGTGSGSAPSMLSEWQQRAHAFSRKHDVPQRLNTLARLLVCAYFFNQIYTKLEIWWFYRQPFPWMHLPYLPASLMVAANVQTVPFAIVLAALATIDSAKIFYTQLEVWWYHGHLYINELMVKKLALLGAVTLILAQRFQAKEGRSITAIPNLLAAKTEGMSTAKSVLMLVDRLLMATLFLYVGVTEIQRQLDTHVVHGGHVHSRRQAGDGHDNMWSKVFEFALSLPFVVGFKVNTVARLLALVLVLEAFISWAWWTSTLNVGYKIHAREHFTVNVGVAGGLMILTSVGAGKYTVDELLKKKE